MIEIKRNALDVIYRFVDNIQLNKITDPIVRKLILKLVIEGKKSAENAEKDIVEIRNKFFNDFKNEDLNAFQEGLNNLTALYRENKIKEALELDHDMTEKYPEITKAHQGFSQALAELEEEPITINIEPVSMDAFIDAMVGQNVELTGRQLDMLSPIFENEPES